MYGNEILPFVFIVLVCGAIIGIVAYQAIINILNEKVN
jgi:hypothetical protein